MENVFRDYGRFENESNNQIICFNVGYIVGVFKPTHWFLTDSNEYVGRWEFEGVEISDSPYLHMDISQLVGKRQNPVSYINM